MRGLVVGAILLASGFPIGFPSDTRAAADQTNGMALMSASIAANNTLDAGSGVVSNTAIATGIHEIVFDRDLNGCTCTATIGATNGTVSSGVPMSIIANCPYVSTAPNSARVSTLQNGSAINIAFHLIVFCPK